MNDVLDDRLADLFDRVAAATEVDENLERAIGGAALEPRRTARPSRWLVATAAAVVAAVGTAGVMYLVDRQPDSTVAETPADPGPLYVLPADLGEWRPINGHLTPHGLSAPYTGFVVGIRADDMFLDPVVVRVGAEPPHGFDPDTWNALSIEGGPAFMSPDDSPDTVVTQQRTDLWMTTRTDDRVVSEVVGAFEAVSLDPTGAVVLQSDDWEVIASFDVGSGSVVAGAFYELWGPSSEHVVVETVSGDVPVLGFGVYRADHLQPITVNGDAAWHPWGIDVDGEWHAVLWEFAPRQVVTLSSHAPFDIVLALAESLEVVDEATWKAATGAD